MKKLLLKSLLALGALVLGGASASAQAVGDGFDYGDIAYKIKTLPADGQPGTADVDGLKVAQGVLVIPETVEYMNAKYTVVGINSGKVSFNSSCGFTEISFPNSIIDFPQFLFFGNTTITKVSLGNKVRTLAGNTFIMMDNLAELVCTTPEPPMAKQAFNGIPKTCVLKVPAASVDKYKAAAGWDEFDIVEDIKGEDPKPAKLEVGATFNFQDFTWTVKTASTDTENGTVELTEALKPETTGTLTIPEVAEYTPENATEVAEKFTVVSIKGAALGQTHYTEIIVPNTVTKLQNLVTNNNYIQKVTLGSGLKEVGFATIGGCPNLTDITILATVPPTANAMAFMNLDQTKVILHVPAGTKAAYQAAEVWKDFTNIEEPKAEVEIVALDTEFTVDGLKYRVTKTIKATGIGEVIFNEAEAQNGVVVVPDEVVYKENKFKITDINGNAFWSKGYTDITLPNTVTTLNSQAIYNCQFLTKLTLGSGLTKLEDNAIYYCKALTSLTCLATVPPTATANSFRAITFDNVTLTVPAGSEDAYKAAEGWKLFTKYTSGVEDINTENNAEEVYYNLQGVKVVNPVEGQVYICVKGNKATKVVY